MKIRNNRVTWTLAFAIAGWSFHSAHAAKDPRVLDQTAEVVTVDEICDRNCPYAEAHSHGINELWDVERGDNFEVNHRLFDSKKFFFDLAWNINSEMQDPNPLLINKGENPFSTLDFSDGGGIARISDFLFLFAIHDLANPNGEPPSPHAVIYLPFRTYKQSDVELGNRYRLWVIHIPKLKTVCDDQPGPSGRLCHALWRLSEKWKSGDYTQQGLAKEVAREAREFLDHVFDGFSQVLVPPTNADPVQYVYDQFIAIRLHNGIIHGTLSGG